MPDSHHPHEADGEELCLLSEEGRDLRKERRWQKPKSLPSPGKTLCQTSLLLGHGTLAELPGYLRPL